MKIKEIAEMAGVSSAAVSRCLNGGSLSLEKKRRIQTVIEKTGYHPNSVAQMLRTGSVRNIGVIIPKINSESVSKVTAGISDVLKEPDNLFFLGNTNNDEVREVMYLNQMHRNHLAGIILMGTVFTPEHRQFFQLHQIPLVISGQFYPNIPCVYHDDFHAAQELTRRMIEKGRKNIAYLGVRDEDIAVGRNRRLGAEAAIKEKFSAGSTGKIHSMMPWIEAGFSQESGYQCMKLLLERNPGIDGVVCATDTIAVGAMLAIRDLGLRIPEDISVAGIGDSSAGTIITPKLTTAHLFYRECGAESARLLLSLIQDQETLPSDMVPVRQTMLGYEIRERESI